MKKYRCIFLWLYLWSWARWSRQRNSARNIFWRYSWRLVLPCLFCRERRFWMYRRL